MNLRFFGILCVRILAGIVAGHLWVAAVAFVFQITGENIVSEHAAIGPPNGFYDYFDSKYDDSNATLFGIAIFRIVSWGALIGNVGCIVLGIIWGFSQDRSNSQK